MIIPLKLEENFKPTGWLGIILGSKIYVDFANKNFTEPFKKLLQQLSLLLENQEPDEKINMKPTHSIPEILLPTEKGNENKELLRKMKIKSRINVLSFGKIVM